MFTLNWEIKATIIAFLTQDGKCADF